MEQLWDTATPLLIDLLSIVLGAALLWATTKFTQRTGITIEAKYRDDLHSALMTGARLAASRQLTGAAAIQLALEYARKSVPDALSKLSPSPVVLKELAESKIQEVADAKAAFELGQVIGNSLKR